MKTYNSDKEAIDGLAASYHALNDEIGKRIIGQSDVVKNVLISIFCNSHSLLIGVPGLAKTLLVKSISEVLDLSFKKSSIYARFDAFRYYWC